MPEAEKARRNAPRKSKAPAAAGRCRMKKIKQGDGRFSVLRLAFFSGL